VYLLPAFCSSLCFTSKYSFTVSLSDIPNLSTSNNRPVYFLKFPFKTENSSHERPPVS
jgi:hypothetical protein